ncbi:hypothetical protein C8R44DRAFT_240746 [Mycena epipterygia]|nr:hypothetical protein C8R44DRAFT_240746 [Mycena epipterygia]
MLASGLPPRHVRSSQNIILSRRQKRAAYPRVDPHLTSGCEVVLDVDRPLGASLEVTVAQIKFLRRLLGLNPRSMLAVLFTETGIIPIRYRRALLALRFAKGFAGIPLQKEDLARAAFRESLRLAGLGYVGWASDLRLASLPGPVSLDSLALLTADGIDGVIKDVETACDGALQGEIDSLVKTQFLKNRLDTDDNGNLKTITLGFRHYLGLVNGPHRIAYTRFLLSDHRLAVETSLTVLLA